MENLTVFFTNITTKMINYFIFFKAVFGCVVLLSCGRLRFHELYDIVVKRFFLAVQSRNTGIDKNTWHECVEWKLGFSYFSPTCSLFSFYFFFFFIVIMSRYNTNDSYLPEWQHWQSDPLNIWTARSLIDVKGSLCLFFNYKENCVFVNNKWNRLPPFVRGQFCFSVSCKLPVMKLSFQSYRTHPFQFP